LLFTPLELYSPSSSEAQLYFVEIFQTTFVNGLEACRFRDVGSIAASGNVARTGHFYRYIELRISYIKYRVKKYRPEISSRGKLSINGANGRGDGRKYLRA
jgi:hypothetical protein